MTKQVSIFVQTEYHLLLSINEIVKTYYDENHYEVRLYLNGCLKCRLSKDLDFSCLPIKTDYYDIPINTDNPLDENTRNKIQFLLDNPPDIFIFFLEQDPLMVILSSGFSKKGSEINLYQDGSKPHIKIKLHSLGLLKDELKLNIWLRKNGFFVESWFSPIYSKNYAYLKTIDKIFLTFPEHYNNWSKKEIEKIVFLPNKTLNQYLKKVFRWDDSLLPQNEKIILFLNLPSDRIKGEVEIELLQSLMERYPNNPLYIKLHPLTKVEKIEQYRQFNNVHIIDSRILAELFIMNLKQSIIISFFSTGMFLNNPECRFYYLHKLFQGKAKQLKRKKIQKIPIDHIKIVTSINEIEF